jgi:hypothetical protein
VKNVITDINFFVLIGTNNGLNYQPVIVLFRPGQLSLPGNFAMFISGKKRQYY